MLATHENKNRQNTTLEEASDELLPYILEPDHWVALSGPDGQPDTKPGKNPNYQRQVGTLKICASVDITPKLEVFLRVAFRAPQLTPAKAADHLEDFLRARIPLVPNSEWQVEIDERQWIHFIRRWTGDTLKA